MGEVPQRHKMRGLRAGHGTQRDALVEAHQPAVIAHGQSQQIQVGELARTMDMRTVKAARVQHTDVVLPEPVLRMPFLG